MKDITVEVTILECGSYGLEDQTARLELYPVHGVDFATLSPKSGSPLTWHIKELVRKDDILTIQGPNTRWRLRVERELG